jgi:hypothetical protein
METSFDSPRTRRVGLAAGILFFITAALAASSGALLDALAHLTMGAGVLLRFVASSGRPTRATLGTVLMFLGVAGMLPEVVRKVLRMVS